MSALKEYPDVTARLLTTCTMKSLSTFYYALERSYQNLQLFDIGKSDEADYSNPSSSE